MPAPNMLGGAPERDSVALAQALQRILDNPDLREQMSRNTRQIIADWDNERMIWGFRQAVAYVLQKNAKTN